MQRPRLHGTDGIRGRIQSFEGTDEDALIALVEKRLLSHRSMRIIGEATGLYLCENIGISPLVLIGWDRRDGNSGLVDALESGLSVAGCRTLRVGEVPTPGIHHAVLSASADAGMMITASHNPATDSGVKLFDSDGYKSMPDDENQISSLAWALVDGSLATPQESGERMEDMDGITLYRGNLKNRLETFCELLNIQFEEVDWSGIIGTQGLVLDCSGGAATSWLADGLNRRGLNCVEVSSLLDPINKNCGAGGLSPTDSWSLEELQLNHREHRLLWTLGQRLQENDGIPPWSKGEIVGAALDGDGDRCLLIQATEHGLKVVDGDLICDDILRATSMMDERPWKVAASIESDLGFSANLTRLNQQHESITTAVGDRWLSVALSSDTMGKQKWLYCEQFPAVIGTEDSGHLVLPVPVPNQDGQWGMVGDGAATLLLALLSRAKLQDGTGPNSFEHGWKKRIAIQPSNRSLWTGDNRLADLMQDTAESWCKSPLQRIAIEGEPALLFLSGNLHEKPISIAIRNSGTEAKTAISVRFSSGIERDGSELIDTLVDTLQPHLNP